MRSHVNQINLQSRTHNYLSIALKTKLLSFTSYDKSCNISQHSRAFDITSIPLAKRM